MSRLIDQRYMFWMPAIILSLLAVVWIIRIETRSEPSVFDLIDQGHPEPIEQAVDGPADLNGRNADGLTPLAYAVQHNSPQSAALLLKAGADVNGESADGETSLHVAVLSGNTKLAEMLLEAGADPYRKNESGVCPFYLAVQKNSPTVSVFLENGAEPDDSSAVPGKGYLCCAAYSGCMPVLLKIISGSPDLNKKTRQGITALHYAVYGRQYEAAKALLEQGADTDLTDRRGCTPLHQAVLERNTEMVQLLLDYHANTEIQDYKGYTPLLHASENGQEAILRQLLDAGADVDATNKERHNAEDLAFFSGHEKILEIIRWQKRSSRDSERGSPVIF